MPLPLNTLPCNLVTGSVLIVVAVAAVVSARIRVESRSSQTSKRIITSALSISHAQTIVPDRVVTSLSFQDNFFLKSISMYSVVPIPISVESVSHCCQVAFFLSSTWGSEDLPVSE